jgi:predicted transglutaminase-like cysteine proteinase
MAIFVKTVRICLFIIAILCANTFTVERPNASALGDADPGVSADDRVGIENEIENKMDDRTLPLLTSFTVSVPNRNQDTTSKDPASILQEAMTAMLSETWTKWTELQSRIRADKETLAGCRSGDRSCPAAARRYLSIVELAQHRQGRAQFGEINRAINLSIRPMSDWVQYGVEDYWASPLTALSNGAGDCEDYAIAKYVALEESGIAPDDLQLEIVRDVQHQTIHAVVAVHYKNEWLILDNRTLFMVNADESPYHYLFTLDHRGVRTYATEVARRRTVQTGVPVSHRYEDKATTLSSYLALAHRLQAAD